MTTVELARAAGLAKGTLTTHSRRVRSALDLVQMDPGWTLPSRLGDNPLAWMIVVDGIVMDARHAPPEIQLQAFIQGAIPFLPDPIPESEGNGNPEDEPGLDPGPLPPDFRVLLEAGFRKALELGPDATLEELDAALSEAVGGYNEVPQEELGGLSPDQVHRLITSDWEGTGSAIQLDPSLSLAELADSRLLDDARIVLALLAGHPKGVKATSKGNFPRAFVNAFRERMRQRATPMEDRYEGREATGVLNEEDVWSLHVVRLLLDLAGLVKKRKGVISRTRRGETLTDESRAGELYSSLLRAQFRGMDLAYLDRAESIPELQYTLGYTLYQLTHSDREWRMANAWLERLVLPAVRGELPAPPPGLGPDFDLGALVLETRFLQPLEAFGLVEARELPRAAGVYPWHREWQPTELLGRAVRFDLGE